MHTYHAVSRKLSLKSLTTLCFLWIVSMSAQATTMEFYRWQFGEFAAQLRYLK